MKATTSDPVDSVLLSACVYWPHQASAAGGEPARQDTEPLQFLPMTASGARAMKWWEFAPMLRRLRGAQHAAQNEGAQ